METDKYSKFEKYLMGDMSVDERTLFEKQMENDPSLEQDFIIFRQIDKDMGAMHRSSSMEEDLKDSLNRLNQEFVLGSEESKPKQAYLIPFLKGVAAVILVLTGVYLLYMSASKDLSQEVSNYYAANYLTLSQTMGSSKEDIQLGIAAYNQGDYETAANLFSDVLGEDPDNSEALKNLGLSFLAMQDYSSALHAFEQYASIPDLFVNDGNILQAVTLLMRGEPADLVKAESVLKDVVNGNQPGKAQAEAWLKKLK